MAHHLQARRRQFQPDHEQQHHHADLGRVADAFGILHDTRAVGPEHHAGDQVGQHRTQAEALEHRHCHDGGQHQHQGQFQTTAMHAYSPVRDALCRAGPLACAHACAICTAAMPGCAVCARHLSAECVRISPATPAPAPSVRERCMARRTWSTHRASDQSLFSRKRRSSGCSGRALNGYTRSNALICASDTCTGWLSTTQSTVSLHGGVVSEPS